MSTRENLPIDFHLSGFQILSISTIDMVVVSGCTVGIVSVFTIDRSVIDGHNGFHTPSIPLFVVVNSVIVVASVVCTVILIVSVTSFSSTTIR